MSAHCNPKKGASQGVHEIPVPGVDAAGAADAALDEGDEDGVGCPADVDATHPASTATAAMPVIAAAADGSRDPRVLPTRPLGTTFTSRISRCKADRSRPDRRVRSASQPRLTCRDLPGGRCQHSGQAATRSSW
jgi:hypothetical protein